MIDHNTETITDMVSKAALPVGVSGLTLFGVSLPDLVQMLTCIYVVFMTLDKCYVMFLRYKASRKGVNEPQE